MKIPFSTFWEIFCWGVDYGQLLMEEERDSEDWADAFQGHIIDVRYSMPAQIAPRRKPHSEAWRNAKKESFNKFMNLAAEIKESESEAASSDFVLSLKKRGHESVFEHAVAGFRIVCDRGVSHEIVRHRIASYSQESTRYCNYGADKFDNEVTFIQPSWLTDNEVELISKDEDLDDDSILGIDAGNSPDRTTISLHELDILNEKYRTTTTFTFTMSCEADIEAYNKILKLFGLYKRTTRLKRRNGKYKY